MYTFCIHQNANSKCCALALLKKCFKKGHPEHDENQNQINITPLIVELLLMQPVQWTISKSSTLRAYRLRNQYLFIQYDCQKKLGYITSHVSQ
uniref:Uncharacterized protein n=1 Tax=Arundo donax TaxID=35708 RepID=A0A0A9DGL1_ARUDO